MTEEDFLMLRLSGVIPPIRRTVDGWVITGSGVLLENGWQTVGQVDKWFTYNGRHYAILVKYGGRTYQLATPWAHAEYSNLVHWTARLAKGVDY